jgi:4-carboxymuconolactone decarboxylase
MTRAISAALCALLGSIVLLAQTPDTSNLGLVGDRFKPLKFETMTPEQKTMTTNVLNGQRRSMGGPFNVLLRSPEMGDLVQKFGEYARFRSTLPKKLNEFAIIMVGRHWTAQYEWYVHKQAALDAGLSPAIVEAVRNNRRPTGMAPDETILYNFTEEVLRTKNVSDATFNSAVKQFGEKGVVDLMGVLGYYQMVSMLLNVDRYPLPSGVAPDLK